MSEIGSAREKVRILSRADYAAGNFGANYRLSRRTSHFCDKLFSVGSLGLFSSFVCVCVGGEGEYRSGGCAVNDLITERFVCSYDSCGCCVFRIWGKLYF